MKSGTRRLPATRPNRKEKFQVTTSVTTTTSNRRTA
jgi:hypothetical protein